MITKKYFFLALLALNCTLVFSQVSICSWNIMNFGKSKSDSELDFIAKTINKYDVIAIQEVVAGKGGAQAVARLVNILENKGFHWDYSISDPTTSANRSSIERYAFIWKTSKVKKIGRSWLDANYANEIDREPYLSTFDYQGKQFTIVTFHAVPKKKNPESEIKYFKLFPGLYPNLNLIFMGDFNCPQSNEVFIPLKKIGYKSSLVNQKTSLRQKCIQNDCLASEYDNMFFNPKKMNATQSGIITFYSSFNSIKEARKISDHVPIWGIFNLK
ncbi:endonuclease/exonuclease/phosphatase family protein [Flavobacterium sp.]|uniref:endonuclease/exonuclease/phosphatase family protein n=1 Tax=Flavobacterium sp. TaxID=239 RepID=UPI00333E992C